MIPLASVSGGAASEPHGTPYQNNGLLCPLTSRSPSSTSLGKRSANRSMSSSCRLVAKLHRPWPGGAPPVRANSSVVPRGVETTTAALVTPSGEDEDASCAPSAVLRSVWTSPGEAGACPPLAHTRRSRAPILTASATTIHQPGDGIGSRRIPDCSVNCGRDAGCPAPPAQFRTCPLRHPAPPLGCAGVGADGKSLARPRMSDFQPGPVGVHKTLESGPLEAVLLRTAA